MLFITNDPAEDFRRYDEEETKWLNKLPRCANCDRPIQDEHYYVINDENVCPECLDNEYRKENDYGE